MPDDTGETLDKIGLACAMAQSYERDQQGFAGLVALLLESSLPSHTQVIRKPVRLFSSEKKIVSVKVSLGDEVYELTDPGSNQPLIAKRSKIVRGIVLKNDTMPLNQWLDELDKAISVAARSNEYASAAISEFFNARGMSI